MHFATVSRKATERSSSLDIVVLSYVCVLINWPPPGGGIKTTISDAENLAMALPETPRMCSLLFTALKLYLGFPLNRENRETQELDGRCRRSGIRHGSSDFWWKAGNSGGMINFSDKTLKIPLLAAMFVIVPSAWRSSNNINRSLCNFLFQKRLEIYLLNKHMFVVMPLYLKQQRSMY